MQGGRTVNRIISSDEADVADRNKNDERDREDLVPYLRRVR